MFYADIKYTIDATGTGGLHAQHAYFYRITVENLSTNNIQLLGR